MDRPYRRSAVISPLSLYFFQSICQQFVGSKDKLISCNNDVSRLVLNVLLNGPSIIAMGFVVLVPGLTNCYRVLLSALLPRYRSPVRPSSAVIVSQFPDGSLLHYIFHQDRIAC